MSATSAIVIHGISPSRFRRHILNSETAAWPETNCYIDVWIPMLHTLELDPLAMLPFCLAADFEVDQWTFAKPSLDDIWTLYNIDVQELNVWDSLLDQSLNQARQGRIVLVEVDSYYLPDTHGTAYQLDHTKTTIAINSIELTARRMRYFHSGGYFVIEGNDFAHVFQLAKKADQPSSPLVPYAEFAKIDRRLCRQPAELRSVSAGLARRHLDRRPSKNPFSQWRPHFAAEMETLVERPAEYYHRYAFANLRQIGAVFKLAAEYLRWLDVEERFRLNEPIAAFDETSDAAKTLMFKIARAMNRKKPLVDEGQLDVMEAAWDRAYSVLPELLDRFASA